MKKIALFALCATVLFACKNGNSDKPAVKEEQPKEENVVKMKSEEPVFEIKTNLGTIKVKLYKETPLHRDNFFKLATQKFYDGIQFHRVINGFMIQTGDPLSKDPNAVAKYGTGGPGYNVPAEFRPELKHKKGALAAARMGDDVNPNRESSGCQFYIVTGRKFREAQLLDMAGQKNNARVDEIFNELARKHMKEIYKLRKAGDNEALLELQDSLEAQAYAQYKEEEPFMFTPEQLTAYSTIGGAPHLDGAYTVFGQVVSGMETVEKIEGTKTGKADRPVENVRILKATVIE